MTSALATDLYQLTMMAGYVAAGVQGRSTFELFVRDMPARRGYLIAAGIEPSHVNSRVGGEEFVENDRLPGDAVEGILPPVTGGRSSSADSGGDCVRRDRREQLRGANSGCAKVSRDSEGCVEQSRL